MKIQSSDYIEGFNLGKSDAINKVYRANPFSDCFRENNTEKYDGYVSGYRKFSLNKPKYSTENLYIGMENSTAVDNTNNSIHAIIYYHNFPLFNTFKWKKDTDWPGKANKWELNRSDIAIKSEYFPSQVLFDSIAEMLNFLEKEFCEDWEPKLPEIN